MKKFISLILTVTMVFTLIAPVSGVLAATDEYITIYVEGYGHKLYKNNVKKEANQIYELNVDIAKSITDVLKPCLEKLAAGIVTGDYDEYCDELYNAFAPHFSKIKLDENGEVTDGSGWGGNMLTSSYKVRYDQGFSGGKITFQYDWRLSVEHNAEILEQFIDRVCREKKVEKVNLLGRCLGGNIVNAYLQNGNNLDKVEKVVMYIPSTLGLSFIGALFSGNIEIDPDAAENAIENLIYNKDIITDPFLKDLVTATVEMLNYAKLLGLGTDALMLIVNKIKDNLFPRIIRDTYGSFPSFWAMVPGEYFDDAVEFCYGTDELKQTYKGMIEKIVSYKTNVQDTAEKRLSELNGAGMDMMIVSKYERPNLPFSKDGNAQSDSMSETYRTSFGSVSPDYGKTFTKSYVNSMSEQDKRFLSPDLKVDASKCLFPEKTWFIKDLTHGSFPGCVDTLINVFLISDDFTVFSSEEYPQFLLYNEQEQTITPVTGLDEEGPSEGSSEERFSVFIRFFTVILNFIKRLINGELNLPFGKAA